jgi:23S rRNA (guanine2445-N2)-methyltransferase
METFFATCPRGLEDVLSGELASLGVGGIAGTPGGVEFTGDLEACYRANLESRVASRVLWRVAGARYASEDDVYRAAHAVSWRDWFGPDQTLRVDVSAIRSPLKSLDFATLRIKDAVCDRLRADTGRRPSVDTRSPDVRVHAFLTADRITLYLDTSGEALFKRGWRRQVTDAPLRENLAAGILRLAGWDPGQPLLDPMCGSGTFLVEAATIALDIAPGLGRRFGFEKLKGFDAATWARLRDAAERRRRRPEPLAIHGSDSDGRAVDASRANVASAGVAAAVTLRRADVLELSAPAPAGVLVANPPYGVRTGAEQVLAEFYPRLGNTLKQRFAGWRAYLFTSDLRLPSLIRLKPTRRTPLYNGAIECRLFEFRMVEGSMKKGRESVADPPDDTSGVR